MNDIQKMTVRIPKRMIEKLDLIAEDEGETRNCIVKRGLNFFLDSKFKEGRKIIVGEENKSYGNH